MRYQIVLNKSRLKMLVLTIIWLISCKWFCNNFDSFWSMNSSKRGNVKRVDVNQETKLEFYNDYAISWLISWLIRIVDKSFLYVSIFVWNIKKCFSVQKQINQKTIVILWLVIVS